MIQMTAALAVEVNETIGRDTIFNCPAGFSDSTQIDDSCFARCNACGGIFWLEKYEGASRR